MSNVAQYMQILPNIVCIGQYCSSDYFSSFLAELWHSYIVQYCQIYPNIVRHWLISSSIDQYCLVTSYLDLFLLKLTSATSIWFRCSKEWATCKYESIQVCMYASMQVCRYVGMQVCKYAIKSKSQAVTFSQSSHFVTF